MKRFRSIISRVVALHIVAIGITSILMPLALYWLLNQAANSLHRDALRSQAATIGSFLHPQPDGGVALDIPPEMQPLYSGGYGLYVYAVLDAAGRVLFSSRNDGAALFPLEQSATAEWFMRPRSTGSVLFGVSVVRVVGQRLYWIQVGQDLAHRDVIIDDIVASFFPRVAWITFPILMVLFLIDIVIFRRVLEPVRVASKTAAAIGPARTDVRLPEQAMPAEIVPLVHAVNQALDRLEADYKAQRDFTAHAAHELRTPLAVLRADLDSRFTPAQLGDVGAEIDSLARVVEQLLCLAQLDSDLAYEVANVDAYACAVEVARDLVPRALAHQQNLSAVTPEASVPTRGNATLIRLVFRNLIENAIQHTPAGTSITVSSPDGRSVVIEDDGPGIPPADRETLFDRFRRGSKAAGPGVGLGLAIAQRVMERSGGRVVLDSASPRGARFVVTFSGPNKVDSDNT